MLDNRKRDDHPTVSLCIHREDADIEIGYWVDFVDWTALINNGHYFKAVVVIQDHGRELDDDIPNKYGSQVLKFIKDELLPKARSEKVEISWRIGWATDEITPQFYTYRRHGIITRMDVPMIGRTKAVVEIEAVDPISWFLNRGKSSGKAYVGRIGGDSGVIGQCIKEYASEIQDLSVHISDTLDNSQNVWQMMRMDPKTFILSLIEWSGSLNGKHLYDSTPWMVQSQDNSINVLKMTDLPVPLDHGLYDRDGRLERPPAPFLRREVVVNSAPSLQQNEVRSEGLHLLNNPILSIFQSKLHTAGISTITGKYFDGVQVWDNNTGSKLNADINEKQGFTKPGSILDREIDDVTQNIPILNEISSVLTNGLEQGLDYSTFINSVPEHNNGDVGVNYRNYIDGRARDYFMRMLYTVMRARVDVVGDPNFDNIGILGPGSVFLNMIDADNKPHFMSGEWMVYGFKHVIQNEDWSTKLFLSRMDWNAIAKKLSGRS